MTIDTQKLAADIQRVMELDGKRLPYSWSYERLGQSVAGISGNQYTRIADIRGWGHLTGGLNLPNPDAAYIQDATGEFIAAAPLMADIIKQQGEVIRELHRELSYAVKTMGTCCIIISGPKTLALAAPLVEGK